MKYIHDVPKSQGVINACKRAKQLVEITWTPVRKLPGSFKVATADGGKRIDGFFAAWRAQQGIGYTGVRRHEKYVGINISLETFMTAMANPNSVLYTRCLHGEGRNTSTYYGNVCSAFVSYVLDLPYMITCADYPTADGFSEVDTTDLNTLEICDVVLNKKSHVLIITDIIRDENGNIHRIIVSESTPPKCITTTFTPEAFRNYYFGRGFKVYRYSGIDRVSYTPSPYVHVEGDPEGEPEEFPTLMTNFGNKANYVKGMDVVELSIFEDGWDYVEVTLPDGTVENVPIEGGSATIHPEKVGIHSACCVSGGKRSHSVFWCVVDIQISTDKERYAQNEPVRVTFRNAETRDKALVYIVKDSGDYNCKRGRILPEEAAAGELIISQNDRMQKGGEMGVVLVFQNEYGKYASKRALFSVGGEKVEVSVSEDFDETRVLVTMP